MTDPGPGRGQHKGTLRRHPHPALVSSADTPSRSCCHGASHPAPAKSQKGYTPEGSRRGF
uniref:hypothetical protein n=1 Tax=Serratia liquefaciens TaxID=614 RepID=UPI001F4C483F|nr:hypothetical protein [Serratia liquefaciens]